MALNTGQDQEKPSIARINAGVKRTPGSRRSGERRGLITRRIGDEHIRTKVDHRDHKMIVLLFDPERYPGELVEITGQEISEYADLIGCDNLGSELHRICGKEYLVLFGQRDPTNRCSGKVSAVNESGFPRIAGKLVICNRDRTTMQGRTLFSGDVDLIAARIARAIDVSTGEQIGTVIILDGRSELEN